MALKTIAIDDEPPALKIIQSFASFTDSISGLHTFSKISEARSHIDTNEVDLLLLDINMPEVSGIDFFKSLHKDIMVIFTTAYSEFAVEGFNLKAIDYLLKPFTLERFKQAIHRAEEYKSVILPGGTPLSDFILLKIDYGERKVFFKDIVYIEGLDDYIKIYTADGKIVVCRMTMKKILEKLPSKYFCRIHRSFIVPIHQVQMVRNKKAVLKNIELPIGGSYEANFYDVYKGLLK